MSAFSGGRVGPVGGCGGCETRRRGCGSWSRGTLPSLKAARGGAQAKATVAAKLSRDSMKPSARKRWTRVADMLETAGTINTHVAFRGAQADAKAAVKAVKAHVEARKAKPNAEQRAIAQVERDVSVLDRARELLGKKILSKGDKREFDAILTAYVRG